MSNWMTSTVALGHSHAAALGSSSTAQTLTYTLAGPTSATAFSVAYATGQSAFGHPVGATALTHGSATGGNFNTTVTMGSGTGLTSNGGFGDAASAFSTTWSHSFGIA